MSGPVYDPYAYAMHEDPYPTYARLRAEAPVYHNPDVGFWALSRHADVMAGFRDGERLSSGHGVSIDPASWGPGAHRTASFLAMDEPRHGRTRALVARGFTPRRVAELEPRVRELARGHLDACLDAGPGTFDFVADLAAKLPMDVISELLGVPHADREEVRRLADLLVHREEGIDDVPPEGIEAALTLAGYYADLVGARRRAPTSDLVSALLGAEIDGDRLADDEIIGIIFLLVVAGGETTTKLLANAWYWAWRYPDERAKPFADPGRVPSWIEETLRFDTSSQLLARITTAPVTLHGVTIPAGERVVLLAGSANRDHAVFSRPDVYDLDRAERELAQTASFGAGRHFCMGASLARLEARVCLEELVARIGSYDLDVERARRVHSVNVRGFASLPTAVRPR